MGKWKAQILPFLQEIWEYAEEIKQVGSFKVNSIALIIVIKIMYQMINTNFLIIFFI